MANFATVTESMRGGYAFLDPAIDDTELVMLATGMIDKQLQFALLLKFKSEPSKTEFETVFEGYGPLSTFSAKIALASALGLVSGDTKHDLKIIRTIRNEFAHPEKRIRLLDYPACQSLRQTPSPALDWADLRKRRFAEACQVTIGTLMALSIVTIVENVLFDEHRETIKARSTELLNWFYDGAKAVKPCWLP